MNNNNNYQTNPKILFFNPIKLNFDESEGEEKFLKENYYKKKLDKKNIEKINLKMKKSLSYPGNKPKTIFKPTKQSNIIVSQMIIEEPSWKDELKNSEFCSNYELIELIQDKEKIKIIKCLHKIDRNIYAVKWINLNKELKSNNKNLREKYALKEIENLAYFNKIDKKGLCIRYYTSCREKNSIFLSMELGPKSLDKYMFENYLFTESQIINIINKIGLIFESFAENKLCHSQIKPENILFDLNNELKLINFAKLIKEEISINSLSDEENFILSSNQLKNTPNLQKYDIFCFGLCLIEIILNDSLIFESIKEDIKKEKETIFINKFQQFKHLSDKLKALITRMLDLEEKNRPEAYELSTFSL